MAADLAVKTREPPLKAGLVRTTTTWLEPRETGGQETAREVGAGVLTTDAWRTRLEVTADLGDVYVSVSTCHQKDNIQIAETINYNLFLLSSF